MEMRQLDPSQARFEVAASCQDEVEVRIFDANSIVIRIGKDGRADRRHGRGPVEKA